MYAGVGKKKSSSLLFMSGIGKITRYSSFFFFFFFFFKFMSLLVLEGERGVQVCILRW